MKFWNNYFPDDIHTVCYENVINNPEQEVRLMLKYLGLDFEKSCMDFHKSSRPVKTASAEQVRQPIYKSGMNYWENYEDDLSTLVKHFPDYDYHSVVSLIPWFKTPYSREFVLS